MSTQPEKMKINCSVDCGNAPRKELLKDFTIAFVKHEKDFWLEWVREDISWEIIGNKKMEGISEFEQELNKMKEILVQQLTIHHIITRGNTASLNGNLILNDNTDIHFCNVYHFGGFGKKAKIKEITSYVIKTS